MRDRRAENLTRHLAAAWSDPATSPSKVRRLALRLTQSELAERAGLAVATVERAERTGVASENSWRALAAALGTQREVIDAAYARQMVPFLREHDC